MDNGKIRLLMTEAQMDAAMKEMAGRVLREKLAHLALVGIQSRGVPLAHWLARHVGQMTENCPKVGVLDINLYRDDLSEVSDQPVVKKTGFPFNVEGASVVLVDDVLYTGRTIRAAMDALIDYGRPRCIKLAVLVDRGWREFPIQADYVGQKIETRADEVVKVMVKEIDGKNEVVLKEEFSKRK